MLGGREQLGTSTGSQKQPAGSLWLTQLIATARRLQGNPPQSRVHLKRNAQDAVVIPVHEKQA